MGHAVVKQNRDFVRAPRVELTVHSTVC